MSYDASLGKIAGDFKSHVYPIVMYTMTHLYRYETLVIVIDIINYG